VTLASLRRQSRRIEGQRELDGLAEDHPARTEAVAAPARNHVVHESVHRLDLARDERPDGDANLAVDGALRDLEGRAAEGQDFRVAGRDHGPERRAGVVAERMLSRGRRDVADLTRAVEARADRDGAEGALPLRRLGD